LNGDASEQRGISRVVLISEGPVLRFIKEHGKDVDMMYVLAVSKVLGRGWKTEFRYRNKVL
jgi:hypothetical protein